MRLIMAFREFSWSKMTGPSKVGKPIADWRVCRLKGRTLPRSRSCDCRPWTTQRLIRYHVVPCICRTDPTRKMSEQECTQLTDGDFSHIARENRVRIEPFKQRLYVGSSHLRGFTEVRLVRMRKSAPA